MGAFLHRRDDAIMKNGRRGRATLFRSICRHNCVFLRHLRRNIIPALLHALLIQGPSVEVGVWLGDYSSVLLNRWKETNLHALVDPYQHFPCPTNGLRDKQCIMSQAVLDQVYANVSKRMTAAYPYRVRMLREFSVEAARSISDASLGFAYIDARHDYDAVLADLQAWWQKVRSGGVVAGHDFTHLPLAKAVSDFLRDRAPTSKIYVTADHPASWIVAKC